MASVFLSYDRDDSAAAKVIATALEKAGHEVWWDLHVRGGAQFSKVIEEALKAADTVVVLWSVNAIESAWVRDEAAAGRDSGRLIPTTIDGTEPPLGFRQFQTIDLYDWKRGAKSRGCRELEGAIAEVRLPDVSREPAVQPNQHLSARAAALVGLPLIGVIAAAAYFLWPASSPAVPIVTVQPASNSAMSQALSRDLLAKLGALQASNSDALQLVEEGGGMTPDLTFKVDASSDSSDSKASLMLFSGRNHALLWSADFDQPSNKPSDLKQQLAYSAANVLDCASDAYGPKGRLLDPQTRRLYLNGCGEFTRVTDTDLDSLLSTFRAVVRRAPRFEGGWALLLEVEDAILYSPPFDRLTSQSREQFRADLAAARKVNPDMAEAYVGEADLLGERDVAVPLHFLDLAVEKNPNNPEALDARSNLLLQFGRMKEAVSDARRAVQIRPFSPLAQEGYISALTYAGQFDAARDALAKAEALFPGASNLEQARYRLNLRYGSPQDALKQLQQDRSLAAADQNLFLKARIDPSAENVARAVDAARSRLEGSTISIGDYIQNLAAFGRTEELINYLLNVPDAEHVVPGVLFRPAFHDFWLDPRSMRVAGRLGLVDYWRSSGHWPDFCSWSELRYNCKKEAAKLAA